MIDLKELRENPDRFRRGITDKGGDVELVDQLVEADTTSRALRARIEELTAEKNQLGRAVGEAAAKLKNARPEDEERMRQRFEDLQKRPNAIKAEQEKLVEPLREADARRDSLWLLVPQPADADVPVGRDASQNVERERWSPDDFDPAKSFEDNRGFSPRSHMELGESLGLFEFERGVRASGSRSYVLTGMGMRLHQAVLRHALDRMVDQHGFTPMSAAALVKHETMVGTGFFPGGRDQVYDVANPTSEDGLALSGTGEVGLMAYHQGEILPHEHLPRKYVTVSTCFRREAGAAGRDAAGLYRIHQFDKVEQVILCEASKEQSRRHHAEMLGFVTGMLRDFGLPHRLLQCCTGDLGLKNADMVDVECWMPSRVAPDAPAGDDSGWGETHSASRLYDYQTRRLNLRYRDPTDAKGKKTTFCHSLNNTVAASPRLLIPLLEMHQRADGSVGVPEVLRPHLGGASEIR